MAGEHVGFRRYVALIRTSHVWLLAPTWIALNAAIGVWLSQSFFQLAKGDPRFPDQALMVGFTANQITIGAIAIAVVFGAGLLYWGNRFKALRRTTIIGYGVGGGAVLVVAGLVVNHFAMTSRSSRSSAGIAAAGGLFVLAGATPAALGLLADMSERFPTDRGAIMGLYSVFLASARSSAASSAGVAADWLGIDGMFIATLVLLGIAVIPLARLRAQEHLLDAVAGPAAPAGTTRVTEGRPWTPVPLARGTPRRGRRAPPPRDRGRAGDPAGRRLAPSMPRSPRTPSSASCMPSGCGIGGDAFWLIWDAAAGGSPRSTGPAGPGRGRRAACAPRG